MYHLLLLETVSSWKSRFIRGSPNCAATSSNHSHQHGTIRICQHADGVSSFAWSPDSRLIVSSCTTEDPTLYFWDALTGEPGERIPLSVYSTKPLSIKTVDWSPDGRFIVAGCDDGTLQVIDALLRRHMLTYRIGDHHEVHCAAWSPDGKWIASGGSEKWGGYSGKVHIWSVSRDAEHSNDHVRQSCSREQ